MFTSSETQELSALGNSSIEFPERLIFVMSLVFHTSEGTSPKPSPAKESSWKVIILKILTTLNRRQMEKPNFERLRKQGCIIFGLGIRINTFFKWSCNLYSYRLMSAYISGSFTFEVRDDRAAMVTASTFTVVVAADSTWINDIVHARH